MRFSTCRRLDAMSCKLAQLAPVRSATVRRPPATTTTISPELKPAEGNPVVRTASFKTENGAQIIANGNQTENNGISIDGISTTSAVWGGATVITPSEDSVDNVKIVSNSYDAENGRFSGAQIQITSKGGSNQFHGSAFFTAHRPGLNAYQPLQRLWRDSDLRDDNLFNQFGGSIGGPIWKNKIFAFFNYETVRSPQLSASTANGWYDTPAFDAWRLPAASPRPISAFPVPALSARASISCNLRDAGLTEGVELRDHSRQGPDVGSPLKTALGHAGSELGEHAQVPALAAVWMASPTLPTYITSEPHDFTATRSTMAASMPMLPPKIASRLPFTGFPSQPGPTSTARARAYNLFHHSADQRRILRHLEPHLFAPVS